MEYLLLGFITGLSLILAIGAQNIFVIEQGLKKQHIFLVCFVCSVSDFILIFLLGCIVFLQPVGKRLSLMSLISARRSIPRTEEITFISLIF